MTDKELYKIKQRADEANDIINALHIERLDYRSEYIPLIESNQDILSLANEIERLQAENTRLKSECANFVNMALINNAPNAMWIL